MHRVQSGSWSVVAAALAAGLLVVFAVPTAAAGDAPLFDAVEAGDAGAVERLLADGVSVQTAEIDGTTALHWAAHHDRLQIAGLLLDAGAAVDATNRYGVTPLALASVNGSTPMIARLLEAGADPNLPNPEGETPLMAAARTGNAGAIETLLAHGADVDAVEAWRGQTALMWATAQNQLTAVEALLGAGADPNARSGRGFTPVLFAAREGHVDVLEPLVRAGADSDDALPANGMSALVLAVYNAQYDFAKALLDLGADPDAAGNGWTALHQVVWTRSPNLGRNPPFPVPLGDLDAFDRRAGPGRGRREPRRPPDGRAARRKPERAQPHRVDSAPAGGEGGRCRDDAASGRPRSRSFARHRGGRDAADGGRRRRHLEDRREPRDQRRGAGSGRAGVEAGQRRQCGRYEWRHGAPWGDSPRRRQHRPLSGGEGGRHRRRERHGLVGRCRWPRACSIRTRSTGIRSW